MNPYGLFVYDSLPNIEQKPVTEAEETRSRRPKRFRLAPSTLLTPKDQQPNMNHPRVNDSYSRIVDNFFSKAEVNHGPPKLLSVYHSKEVDNTGMKIEYNHIGKEKSFFDGLELGSRLDKYLDGCL